MADCSPHLSFPICHAWTCTDLIVVISSRCDGLLQDAAADAAGVGKNILAMTSCPPLTIR